jgi:hypothetical protein
VPKMLVLDYGVSRDMVRQRKKLGLDRYDEVWDGVYVMPSMANLDHQELVLEMAGLFKDVVKEAGGKVYPGANVSDRPKNWKKNYRIPDIVVLLKNSRAKKRDTFILGGPDFLTEIESPDEDPEEKIPFYSKIQVQELLIIHRDRRDLRLLRHDGEELVQVEPTWLQGGQWLVSTVLRLAFRKVVVKGKPRTEIHRTDGVPGRWVV